jgi:nifR3 family TIM-barrel protein
MLQIDQREKNIGLQLFGEDGISMGEAAKVAQDFAPNFIDINMGCPVKKVVTKGSGSALLKDTAKLGQFFSAIKSSVEVPVTIKIRTGWDADSRNAPEVLRIAREEGISFVAIHGRTRAQQYQGKADWDYLEWVAAESPLPLIGNGDLNRSEAIRTRLKETKCRGLMLGRGPLRDPFLFLKVNDVENEYNFTPSDYGEAVEVLAQLMLAHAENERESLTNIKKHTVWMSAGLKHAGSFRQEIFASHSVEQVLALAQTFYRHQSAANFNLVMEQDFMMGGHG